MAKQATRGIVITAKARYVPEQSPPGQYGFVYGIEIENRGDETAQLLRRHWIITDAMGNVREVEGEGVVGMQPVLKPGQSFAYQSGSLLPTPVGTMRGTYQMITEKGAIFEAEIPEFMLSANQALH